MIAADVVIVTWKSRGRVLACLERLTAQRRGERIVVVDNASHDGTVERVRERFPDIEVLELLENRGFGGAVNAAAAQGVGEAIVLVNDDVEVCEGFLEAITAPLAEQARCGMVAGMTLLPNSGLVDGFGIELDVTLAAYNRLRYEPVGERAGRLAMPSGGLVAYRRRAFEEVGGFEERLRAYGEDVDIGLRLRLAGWGAAEAAGAQGVHAGAASIGRDSTLQRELAGFARGFLLRRYGVLQSPAAARALLFELLVVGWGLVRHRSLVPLIARLRGWRAAGRVRHPIPPDTVDPSITARQAFRRLRATR